MGLKRQAQGAIGAGVFWLLAASAGGASRPAPRPDVVLVTVDTTRADRIGCYGRKEAGTPRLDALAQAGVRFDAAWSPVPVTLPAHVSMMTGAWPPVHGVRDNGDTRFDGRVAPLAMRFREAGFSTAAVVSAAVLDRVWGLDAGFATYDDLLGGRGERTAADATARALSIAKGLKRPFFLWVHYYDPHWPYAPPSPYRERYATDPYQGEIATMDAEIGRLLDGLAGLGSRPVVAVAGDHGEGLGDHGERTHGLFTYRSTLRVPLLLAGPGLPRGRVVDEPVSLVDLAPTLAALAGLPPSKPVDGESLLPRLGSDPSSSPPRWLYYESMLPFNSFGWVPPRGVTDGRWSYIELPRREVFDLRVDPAQAKNLWRDDDPLGASLRRRFDEAAGDLAGRAAAGSPVPLSAEERARLASLGYLGGLSSKGTAEPTLDPKDVVDLFDKSDQARDLSEKGKHGEALALADEIVGRNPENVPALSIRGRSLAALGRHREAVAVFRDVLARNDGLAIVHFNLGSSLEALDRRSDAEASWTRATRLEPRFAEPRAKLISSRLEVGDLPGAMEVVRASEEAGAESAEVFFMSGLARAQSGDMKGARRGFERAVGLRPGFVEALGNLARIDYQEGKVDAAVAGYRSAIAASGGRNGALRKILGALLLERGDPSGALSEFRGALAVETDGAERARLGEIVGELEAALGVSR